MDIKNMFKKKRVLSILVLFIVVVWGFYQLSELIPNNERVNTIRTITKFSFFMKSALLVYYIDNKQFPSEEKGLAYCLTHTGKNPPYFYFFDKYPFGDVISVVRCHNGRKKVIEDMKQVKENDMIKIGNIRLEYKLQSQRKFLLNYLDEKGNLFYSNRSLPFGVSFEKKNEFDYMKDPSSKTGAEIIFKSPDFYFYIPDK